jgi:hypothetical protein
MRGAGPAKAVLTEAANVGDRALKRDGAAWGEVRLAAGLGPAPMAREGNHDAGRSLFRR